MKTDDYREHVRGFARSYLKDQLVIGELQTCPLIGKYWVFSCMICIEKFLDLIEDFEIMISTADLKSKGGFRDEDIQ